MSQLIQHERIETTVQKAKELRRLADKVVTLGKQVRASGHAMPGQGGWAVSTEELLLHTESQCCTSVAASYPACSCAGPTGRSVAAHVLDAKRAVSEPMVPCLPPLAHATGRPLIAAAGGQPGQRRGPAAQAV